jgi:SAM-dependent methyltransferase
VDLIERPAASGFARHPWEVARADFFAGILQPVLDESATSLLDAGAGDGWFARRIAADHPGLMVVCYDPGYADGVIDGLPRADRVEYVASQPAGQFGVVTLLDVIEHVSDDAALLADLRDVLRPGGHMLVSVPAWQRLFSRHDVALEHFRRYHPHQLTDVLTRTRLQLVASGGLFHSLLSARAAAVAVERLVDGAGRSPAVAPQHELEWRGGDASRRLVEACMRADTRLSAWTSRRNLQLPGLSCWALCRKTS